MTQRQIRLAEMVLVWIGEGYRPSSSPAGTRTEQPLPEQPAAPPEDQVTDDEQQPAQLDDDNASITDEQPVPPRSGLGVNNSPYPDPHWYSHCSGLLKTIGSVSVQHPLKAFTGQVMGVDAHAWLHELGCSAGIRTAATREVLVSAMVGRCYICHKLGIRLLLVFDGLLDQNRAAKRAADLVDGFGLRPSKLVDKKAVTKLQQAAQSITLSRSVLVAVQRALSDRGQLTHLAQQGYVNCVVTNDVDLLTLGCPCKVLIKTHYGLLGDSAHVIDCEQLFNSVNEQQQVLQWMANWRERDGLVYLAALRSSGYHKLKGNNSLAILSENEWDVKKIASEAVKQTRLRLEHKTEFVEEFQTTVDWYKGDQLVFDPSQQQVISLNGEHSTQGDAITDSKVAVEVAAGRISAATLEPLEMPEAETGASMGTVPRETQQTCRGDHGGDAGEHWWSGWKHQPIVPIEEEEEEESTAAPEETATNIQVILDVKKDAIADDSVPFEFVDPENPERSSLNPALVLFNEVHELLEHVRTLPCL